MCLSDDEKAIPYSQWLSRDNQHDEKNQHGPNQYAAMDKKYLSGDIFLQIGMICQKLFPARYLHTSHIWIPSMLVVLRPLGCL